MPVHALVLDVGVVALLVGAAAVGPPPRHSQAQAAGAPNPFAACSTTERVEAHTGLPVTVRVGDCLLVALGRHYRDYIWTTITVSDPVTLQEIEIEPEQLPVDAQALYQAQRPGSAVLEAHGVLPCHFSPPPIPPCAAPAAGVRVDVIVQDTAHE